MKTIGLNDEAYRRLETLKTPGDSFSDVVLRLTGGHLLRRLAGTMPPEIAEEYHDAIRHGRAQEDHERRARVKGME